MLPITLHFPRTRKVKVSVSKINFLNKLTPRYVAHHTSFFQPIQIATAGLSALIHYFNSFLYFLFFILSLREKIILRFIFG